MAFSNEDKERVRYHLGYSSVSAVPAYFMGFPRATEPQWLVEVAMNNVLPEGEMRVRQIVGVMDGLEQKLVEATGRFAAKEVGEIVLRDDECDLLRNEYAHWRNQLGSALGIFPNPASPISGGGISVPVRG